MKKLISIALCLVLLCSLGLSAWAAEGEDTEVFTKLPGQSSRDVIVNVVLDIDGWYGPVEDDGSATVLDEGGGVSAYAPPGSAPEGAVWLVVQPIHPGDPAWDWIASQLPEDWTGVGDFYYVYWLDMGGNTYPAEGVTVTVVVVDGETYVLVNGFSVDADGSCVDLGAGYEDGVLSFVTDGSFYYAPAHHPGAVGAGSQSGPGAPETDIDMDPSDFEDAVLTPEDELLIEEGHTLDFVLTVNDITDTVSQADQSTVEAAAGDFTVGQYLDVELLEYIDGEFDHYVTETRRPIRIVFNLTEDILGHQEYAIVRLHEGRASFQRDLDSVPETVTIETDQFSTYAILYRDPVPVTPSPSPTPGESPKTGDESPITALAALQVLSLAGLALAWKKRKA